MVGERVRFLFSSGLLQVNEWVQREKMARIFFPVFGYDRIDILRHVLVQFCCQNIFRFSFFILGFQKQV
jgi:hypothetical protein